MLKEIRQEFEGLQPLVERMQEKPASEFATLMADCRTAAESANKLEEHIKDCKIKHAELREGMTQADDDQMQTFLAGLDDVLNKVNLHLYTLGRYADMYANLETVALITEEKWQAANEEVQQ
jgi:hypothetical protein